MKYGLKTLVKEHFLLISILILAACIRLYRIGEYMTFLGDEGRDVLVVYNILHGDLTLLGPTASVGGFFMGPAYYYLMAPFLWLFSYNPIGPAVMVVITALLTMVLMYKICTEFFNKTTGIIAALLYAVAPVVIVYSRASWNPNVMPFFTILTLYTLYLGIKKSKWWLFLFSGFLYGIDVQLHYVELFVGAIIILYVLLMRLTQKQVHTVQKLVQIGKDGMFLFIGFLVGFSPFLAFEFRHGFQNLASIRKYIFDSEDVSGTGNFIGNITDVFYRLFGRIVTNFPTVPEQSVYDKTLLSLWTFFVLFLAIGSIAVFIYTFYTVRKKREKIQQYSLLALWLFVGVLFFGFYKKNIHDYYLEFLFPLPFIFIGYFLWFLWKKHTIGKLVSTASLCIILFICFNYAPFLYEPNNQLNRTKEIATFILQKANDKPFNFAYISTGNSDHSYRYFFRLAEKDPVQIENLQLDPKRTSVTDQLLVICDSACSPIGHSLWEVAGFGQARIVGKWKVSIVDVYKLERISQK